MKKLKIQAKLLVMVLPLAILAVILLLSAVTYLKNVKAKTTNLYYSQLYEGNSTLINADRDFYQAYTALLNYLTGKYMGGGSKYDVNMEDFNENMDQTSERVNKLTEIIENYPSLASYKYTAEDGSTFTISDQIAAFNANMEKLNQVGGGKYTFTNLTEFDEIFNATRDNISNMEDLIEAYALSEDANVNKSINIMVMQIIVFTLVVLVIIGIITTRLVVYFRKSLVKVANEINGISAKDLTVEATQIEGVDEIAQLSRAADGLKETLANVMMTLNASSEELSESSDRMARNTSETVQSVQSIDTAANELANTATQQAQDVSQIACEVNNIEEISKQSLEDTDKLAGACVDIEKITKTGMNTVNDLTKVTEQSMEAYNSIFEVIAGIDEKTKNIGVASDMITAIASQTNLLSLNASIEAARAGEAGRGFAVVADEIRQLAEQSASSANTINTMLSELMKSASEATKESQRVKEYVEQQRQSVMDTKAGFEEIVSNVGIVNEGVDSLRDVNADLGGKVSAISILVESLSAISEENAATAEELSATTSTVAENIDELANTGNLVNSSAINLADIVAEYKLEVVEEAE